jgi:predicted glycogen debranching enzyme
VPPQETVVRDIRRPLEWSGAELPDRARRLALEWVESDGLGGYACGTVAGARTRRYHGWYVPAIPPPRRRWALVAGCEEFVAGPGGVETAISTQIYPGTVHPEGDRHLARFALEPFPCWTYRVGAAEVERSLCLVRDRSVTIVRYANAGTESIGLRVRPLLPFRSADALQRENPDFDTRVEARGEVSSVRPLPYLPRLYLRGVGAETALEPVWYRDFEYPLEVERGYEAREDLWSPIVWRCSLAPGQAAFLLFSLEEVAADPAHLLDSERRRRESFARTGDPLFDELARRAEVFLVEGDYRAATILAGYPWFADRGRDAMAAAAGLAIPSGRYGSVARVLNTYAALLQDGLLPSNFSAKEAEAQYGSVDAPLWFILAIEWFARARRNPNRPAPLLASVRAILGSFRRGTRYGIRVGRDGLLAASDPLRPLTWMDAVVDGEPVTPRRGRAVEVNALWHAALKCAARLERLAGETARARELEAEAWHVARKFNELFWNPEKSYLHDVLGEDGADSTIRPNQILAVSLTDDLLPPHRARAVYWTVRRRLLTPFGLRTLDPRDPAYRGRCGGTQREFDLAYHQGSVWPWLLGPFADAHFRVFGRRPDARRTLRGWLAPLRAHVRDAGVGSISEVFDGDSPHAPRGCFAHAWTVAEVLRVVYQYLQEPD